MNFQTDLKNDRIPVRTKGNPLSLGGKFFKGVSGERAPGAPVPFQSAKSGNKGSNSKFVAIIRHVTTIIKIATINCHGGGKC